MSVYIIVYTLTIQCLIIDINSLVYIYSVHGEFAKTKEKERKKRTF